MAVARYQLTGLPSEAANGTSAFLPWLTRYAASGAQSYKYGIAGGPSLGIPADTSHTQVAPHDKVAQAMMGVARSSDAPDAWFPDHYQVVNNRAELPGAGMPMQRYNPVRPQDTTMIPVPAVSLAAALRANQANLAYGVEPGGQRQVKAWPRGLAKWRGRNSNAGNQD